MPHIQKGNVVKSPDPAKIKAHDKRIRDRLRLLVLKTYSGGAPACACCGETQLEFLCIDHINGCGSELRKAQGGAGHRLYATLKREGFPEGYRVLCHNCNSAFGFYGYCPHTKEAHVETAERHEQYELGIEFAEGQVYEIPHIIPEVIPESLQRFGEQPLSPTHQAAIQAGVTLIHEALDMPHAAIYNELRRQFKVAKYDQIPDMRWADVVAWFGPRVELALRRSPTDTDDPFADDSLAQGRMF